MNFRSYDNIFLTYNRLAFSVLKHFFSLYLFVDGPHLELAITKLYLCVNWTQPLRDVRPVPSHGGSHRLR